MGPPKPNLRDYEPLAPDASPLVSIIIPARNESHNIERCLRSILKSDYRKIQVIVVDDRSTDNTARIAERVALDDARLLVVRGENLPKGWYGKPWACWQGFALAQGPILLFTDADTVHGPHLLSRAVAALETERVDLLTVMPHQEMTGFWERTVQPFFFLLLGLRFGTPRRLNRNRNPRHAIANGQFILVTRDSYEWVGGHKRVHDTVIEDLLLAVRYTEAGRRLFFALADDDMSVRMYTTLGGIVEGWSKNFFRGTLETMRSRALTYVAVLGTLWMPLAFLAPSVMLVVGALTRSAAQLAFGAASFLGCSLLIGAVLRAGRVPMWYGIFHPLGALVLARILLRSARRGTGRIEWKGRTYSHA